MKYLQNNLNLALLGLFVLVILSFAGFTTFYRHTYYNLTQDYESKIEKLDTLTEQLQTEKTRLQNTSAQLQLKQERESNLQGQYGNLRQRNQELEQDIEVLRGDYNAKVARVLELEREVDEATAQIQAVREVFNEKIDRLTIQLSNCRNDLEQCEAS